MPTLSEDHRRFLERWTLLVGGVEMLIGAAMSAFPDVFPSWLTLIALAIALVTIGAGLVLVWGDIAKLRALLPVRPNLIGIAIAAVGLAIIVGLAFRYLYQAPPGTFAGSSVPIVLAAAILLVSYFLLFRGPQASSEKQNNQVTPTNSPEVEKNRLKDRIRVLDRALHRLMDLEIDRLERVVMVQLIAESPKFADDEDISTETNLMKERTPQLQRYLDLVSSEIQSMKRHRPDIRVGLKLAEKDVVERLQKSPDVAPGVNAYVYRDYAIALAKWRFAIAYMKKEIEASERTDMQYLGDMVAHEKNLEPKIFDSGF